jgi:hypothetical protein
MLKVLVQNVTDFNAEKASEVMLEQEEIKMEQVSTVDTADEIAQIIALRKSAMAVDQATLVDSQPILEASIPQHDVQVGDKPEINTQSKYVLSLDTLNDSENFLELEQRKSILEQRDEWSGWLNETLERLDKRNDDVVVEQEVVSPSPGGDVKLFEELMAAEAKKTTVTIETPLADSDATSSDEDAIAVTVGLLQMRKRSADIGGTGPTLAPTQSNIVEPTETLIQENNNTNTNHNEITHIEAQEKHESYPSSTSSNVSPFFEDRTYLLQEPAEQTEPKEQLYTHVNESEYNMDSANCKQRDDRLSLSHVHEVIETSEVNDVTEASEYYEQGREDEESQVIQEEIIDSFADKPLPVSGEAQETASLDGSSSAASLNDALATVEIPDDLTYSVLENSRSAWTPDHYQSSSSDIKRLVVVNPDTESDFLPSPPAEASAGPLARLDSPDQIKRHHMLTEILFLIQITSKAVTFPRKQTFLQKLVKPKNRSMQAEGASHFLEIRKGLKQMDPSGDAKRDTTKLGYSPTSFWIELYRDVMDDVEFEVLAKRYADLKFTL